MLLLPNSTSIELLKLFVNPFLICLALKLVAVAAFDVTVIVQTSLLYFKIGGV